MCLSSRINFMNMKKVVVVGFGFMGMTHTINIIKNNELELVAIVDTDTDGIERKLNQDEGNFSTGNIDPNLIKHISKYRSFSDCIKHEEFDAVHICVHTDLHYSIAKEALVAGKNVLLEKPFCLDIKQGEELITLASEKGLILMVAHVLRFIPAYLKLKSWIETKEYGNLKFLSMSRYSGVPLWGEWENKQSEFGSSGGALFDLLIHDIDFVNFVFGKPEKINSTYLPGKLSNHDYISAWWDYDDFKVKVEGGNTFHSNFPFQANFMAEFEDASVLYTTHNPDHLQVSNNKETELILTGDGDGYYNEIEYFTNCIQANSQPKLCMPQSALQSIELCYKHL